MLIHIGCGAACPLGGAWGGWAATPPQQRAAEAALCCYGFVLAAAISSLTNLPLFGCFCNHSQFSWSHLKLNIFCDWVPRGAYSLRTLWSASTFLVIEVYYLV